MYQYKDVKIRRFTFDDIPLKIEWINNPENNEFLHYDLPLEYDKTVKWLKKNENSKTRFDAVIEYNGNPVGLAGLLNIDTKNLKAEDYITIGETAFKQKGIATKAGVLIALYGFEILKLHKLYAYIEVGNPSLKLYLKKGFHVEGFLRNDLCMNGRFVDRYVLGLSKEDLRMAGEPYWEKEQ